MAAFETLKITLSCRYWNLKLIVGTQLVKVTSIQHTDKPPKAGDRWDQVPVLCEVANAYNQKCRGLAVSELPEQTDMLASS